MKKGLIYIIIFSLMVLIANYGIEYSLAKQWENRSPIQLAFASIGANSLESRLDCWAMLNTSSNKRDLNEYLEKITEQLQINLDESQLFYYYSNNLIELRYKHKNENICYYFTLQSDFINNRTNIITRIETTNSQVNLSEYAEQLQGIKQIKWHNYYLYSAVIEPLAQLENHALVGQVLMANLKADQVDEYSENLTYSLTCYSKVANKVLPETNVQGKKFNLQIALKNNSQDNSTRVYIGSPLILGDY
ncbi:MAG: YwmB family TATA-box binding protein [Syntrophomonadaceae bacterium]|nr:YwmB family TATA-box binding protein [Syntrophomonadaceae bacterium]